MKNIVTICAFSILLASCMASGDNYYFFKAGQSVEWLEKDYQLCKSEVLGGVVQKISSKKNNDKTSADGQKCSIAQKNAKQCKQNDKSIEEAVTKEVTQNADYYKKRILRCVQSKGYEFMLLPECTSKEDVTKALSARKSSDVLCSPAHGFLTE